jgi:hypothetical protein
MNWKREQTDRRDGDNRFRVLERRIEELEKRLAREKSLLLDEDMKARGLK